MSRIKFLASALSIFLSVGGIKAMSCGPQLEVSPRNQDSARARQTISALVMNHRTADAVAAADKYLQEHPDDPDAYVIRAQMDITLRHYADAVRHITKGLQVDPNDRNCLTLSKIVCSYLGQTKLPSAGQLSNPRRFLIPYEDAKHLYGYTDLNGKMALIARWGYASSFVEGRAIVEDPRNRRLGYIDTTGRLSIPCTFTHAYPFHNGLAVVVARDEINQCEEPYPGGDVVGWLSRNEARRMERRELLGAIDKTGRWRGTRLNPKEADQSQQPITISKGWYIVPSPDLGWIVSSKP